MKEIFLIFLFSFSLSVPIFNQSFYEDLKKDAPFEIYSPEENPFRDYTYEELKGMFNKPGSYVQELSEINLENILSYQNNLRALPESYDFRVEHKECTFSIRNQGECSASFAFAGTMSLQERLCIKSSGTIRKQLSPQYVLSCYAAKFYCNGGTIAGFWQYMKTYGTPTESCYPYVATHKEKVICPNKCNSEDEPFKRYKISSYYTSFGEANLKNSVYKEGPVTTYFNIYEDFLTYKSGIYVHTKGELIGEHNIVVVGWGVENGTKYYICKNSFGSSWGESGYFRIKTGDRDMENHVIAGIAKIES